MATNGQKLRVNTITLKIAFPTVKDLCRKGKTCKGINILLPSQVYSIELHVTCSLVYTVVDLSFNVL